MRSSADIRRTELPYLNNLPMALLICAINIPLAFVFQYGRQLNTSDLILDAAICGFTSAFFSLLYTNRAVASRRKLGSLPVEVPQSAFMQKLPRGLLPLVMLTGIAGAAVMALITLMLVRFFPATTYTFSRFIVWKIAYAIILAAKIIEFGIFRYVQPDCIRPEDPPRQGIQSVKNPLPRSDIFSKLYASVTTDFGMNMLLGLALGGTVISGDMVILMGVAQSGVWISGLVLGIIVSVLMVQPTFRGTYQIALTGGLPPAEKPCHFLSVLPEHPWKLTGIFVLPVMVLSALVLWAALWFFGFETLNFFQFFLIRTAYVKLLSKGVEALAVYRYRQIPPRAAQPSPSEEA